MISAPAPGPLMLFGGRAGAFKTLNGTTTPPILSEKPLNDLLIMNNQTFVTLLLYNLKSLSQGLWILLWLRDLTLAYGFSSRFDSGLAKDLIRNVAAKEYRL